MLDNQPESTKVLGITATPRRDADGINMANEIAQRLGYTNREAVSGKHIAMNMSLTNAIRMGLVVNPKLVSCAYSLKTDGSLDELKDKIDQIEDVQDRNEKLEEYESLRKNVENAEGIPQILQANVKKGGKYIVFLPVVEDLEDEDGNVTGRKKGKTKIEDYEKQIAEYFEDSDIIPHFNSMLGEYGDKENARRLEEFQNSNTEATEFMLVMNKANEGLHLDKLDGIIWLRPLDENSRILYLQQLGRVIYSENPDRPTKDEDRPVVIDLVNNTIKVNWDNEITEQSDIQMLNLIVDWAESHDGVLSDINSTDKEEVGYARVLKEIQSKYKEYLEQEFDGLNEKQIEEIEEIIRLGSQIDLWQIELPDRIAKSGETRVRSFTGKNVGPFELTGLLKDFVELEDEVDGEPKKTTYEQVIEFLATQGRIMQGGFSEKGKDGKRKKLTRGQMSEEQKEEVNLYRMWWKSDEYKILKEYAGQPIENVPEEYREKIATLRQYGLGQEKPIYEQVIEFMATQGRIMQGVFSEKGEDGKRKQLTRDQMSAEQKEEVILYKRWQKSDEYKILKKYAGQPIENVPEEYKEKIETLRQHGLGQEKPIYEQVIEFLATKGRIMQSGFSEKGKDGKSKKMIRGQMSEEQKEEANLYRRWQKSDEYKILKKYAGQPIENVPEEYKEKIETLRQYGLGQEKPIYEQVIEFLATKGRIMQSGFFEKGKDGKRKQLTRGQMSEEQKEEVNLYDRWNNSDEYKILKKYAGQPIENVPEEYRKKIATLRQYALEQEKPIYEQVIEFFKKYGRIMKGSFYEKGEDGKIKKLTRGQISEEQKEEASLYDRWQNSDEYKILQEYIGQPIERVPEEYREKIATLRQYGIEPKPKRNRTAKEIAKATISSLKDPEMLDREDEALKRLQEHTIETKEGGKEPDEQP